MSYTNYSLLLFYLVLNQYDQAFTQEINKTKFPIEQSLIAKPIKVPSIIYAKMPGFVITGKYLLLLRSFNEPLFSVFELADCNYMGDFGRLGRGPNEFGKPDSRNAIATSKGFVIYDVEKGLLFIDLKESILNKYPHIIRTIKLPGELFMLNDIIMLNDCTIVGFPYVDKSNKPYVRYNFKTNEIEYFGKYPAIYSKSKKEHFWPIFWRHSVTKPDGKKFASFFDAVKMFRIYDEFGNLENETIIEIQDLFQGQARKSNIITYYHTVKATNQFIYALCLDVRTNKLLDYRPTLEIWDWNGNPVAAYTLDRDIFTFDITDDNKYIYCMDRQTIDKIFVYYLDINP